SAPALPRAGTADLALRADLQAGEPLALAPPRFAQVADGLAPGGLEVALLGLVYPPLLLLAKAQLQGGVAVPFGGAFVHDHARTGLNDRHRHRVAGFVKDLRHANLSAQNAFGHPAAPPMPGLKPQRGARAAHPGPAYSLPHRPRGRERRTTA